MSVNDLLKRRKIKSLPKNVADRIAAGEVVDRPVSIVKELVENSIDSGADSIIIEIKNGGKSYIRVTDNGCGIPSEDVEAAFLRHATNKIVSDDDLMKIETLGFRGEALASIAAVTRAQMITKIPESETGTKIIIEGGRVIEKLPVGASNGTTIVVENLFFNTPAREKFLKKDGTESGLIIDLISKISLAYPDIRIKMINNGKILFNTSGNGKILENIYSIYGKETASNLFYFENELEGMKLKGYISNPIYNKSNRRNQFYFVNGRSIVNHALEDGIAKGYGDKMPESRFPVAYIFLNIPPDSVDVNVHPNKKEVRFGNPLKIREFVKNSVFRALNTENGIGKISESVILKNNYNYSDNSSNISKQSKNIFSSEDMKADESVQEKMDIFGSQNMNSGNDKLIDNVEKKENKESNKKFSPKSSRIEVIKLEKDDDFKDENEISLKNNSDYIIKHSTNSFSKKSDFRNLHLKNESGVRITDTKPLKIDYRSDENNIKDNKIAEDESTDYSFNNNSETEIKEENKKVNAFTECEKQHSEIHYGIENISNSSLKYSKFDVSNIEVMGIAFDTYIAAKDYNNFYLIDQHAAHERVFYEKFLNQFNRADINNQMILTPIVREIPYYADEEKENWFDFLIKSGFSIESFGERSYIVRAIPSYMDISEAECFLDDYIDSISDNTDFKDRKTLDKIIMRSCKSAVKAHDKLSKIEVDALLRELSKTENPFSCPHGRPVIIKMSIRDMEKMFKRV